jgi:hypothetical protein
MIAAEQVLTLTAELVSIAGAIAGMFTMIHYTVRYVMDVSNNWRTEAVAERERAQLAEAELAKCREDLRNRPSP